MPPTELKLEPHLIGFLTDQLGQREFEVVPLAGDASSRRYYRIVSHTDSWVLMSWEPFQDAVSYPFLNIQRHFHSNQVQVPYIMATSPKLGLILQEDLGDLTLERKFWENQNQDQVIPYYEKALDELVKIHYVAGRDFDLGVSAFTTKFDTEKFVWEMNYGKTHLSQMCGIQIAPVENQSLEAIFTDISRKLDAEPKTISHRDYHSRNLMLKLNRMRVIDFQDARQGPVQYDLVSLLHDSYVNLEPAFQDHLLRYYIEQARRHGANLGSAQFYNIFDLQLIQRCFKACGSFASFYNMRGDRRYLKYIQPTLRKVFENLRRFPEYVAFADWLCQHRLVEKDYENL